MTEPISPRDFSEIRWRGHWIWVPEEPVQPSGFISAPIDPRAPEAHGLFRKTIVLDGRPERAPARITTVPCNLFPVTLPILTSGF